MVAEYKNHLNAQGTFGPALDLHAINEQQLSGHGWFLRGLCEYYEWKRDPQTLAQIRAVVHNLALPLRGSYAKYPSILRCVRALRRRRIRVRSMGSSTGNMAIGRYRAIQDARLSSSMGWRTRGWCCRRRAMQMRRR